MDLQQLKAMLKIVGFKKSIDTCANVRYEFETSKKSKNIHVWIGQLTVGCNKVHVFKSDDMQPISDKVEKLLEICSE